MKKIYIIAAIVAILTSVLIYKFALNLEELSKPEDIPRSDVVIAAQAIPVNTVLTKDMLKTISIPSEAIVSGSCSTPEELIGRIVTVPFVSGEQVIISQTAAKGDKNFGKLSIELDENRFAMTIEVGTTSGVAGYIRVGDKINLIVTKSKEDDESVTETIIVARNIPVLRLGPSSSSGLDTYTSLTLSVTEKQALDIIYNSTLGSLRAVLVPAFNEQSQKAS